MTNGDAAAAAHRAELKRRFAAAVELDAEARADYLARECPRELRTELAELLAHAADDGFLAPASETPLALPDCGGDGLGGDLGSVPRRLGAYAIEREIGSGGMGRVFLATQDKPRRPVALKIMHYHGSSELAVRFAREAELLGRLEHPGIARIYEAGVDATLGVPFLAMEFVAGAGLLDHVSRAELDDRARLELVAAIADAVAHAHQKGVIHRDLKPGNVLVTSRGQPVILDFGIARPAASEPDLETTRAGQVLGTVAYMSPEQAAGRITDVDTRADVWALGVIAFELLSRGQRPHELDDLGLTAALQRLVEQSPRSLASVAPGLRGDVSTIVDKALATDRDRRYPTAAALADDVRRFLASEPISARPATTVYQLRKFAARHRGLVLAVGGALLALVIGASIAAWQAVVAHDAAGRERVARQRAERRLGDVQEFATHSVFRVHDRIKHLPGAAEGRQMLVDLGLEALRKLHAEEGDDPRLMRQVAQAYLWQGRLRGGDTSHRGDSTSAGECFGEAVRLWRLVVDSDHPEQSTDASKYGLALYYLARHHVDAERSDVAQRLLREAVAVMRPAVARYPAEIDLPGDLGAVLNQLGRLRLRRGDRAGAIALFDEALVQSRESLRRSTTPADRAYQLRGLVVSHSWLGNFYFEAGELDRAWREYESFHECAAAGHELMPQNELDQSNLAVAEGKLARVLLARGQPVAAIERLRRGFDLLEPLVAEDPGNLRRVFQLFSTQRKLMQALHELGRDHDVLAELAATEAFEPALAGGAGENRTWQRALAWRGACAARAHARLGAPGAALAALGATVDAARRGHVAAADGADPSAVREAAAVARARASVLHAVLFAAAALTDHRLIGR
ncbi:MAG: serine/threonine protein kinase [bacterium]|nr:serine/threonine protein kinase [bacterium]